MIAKTCAMQSVGQLPVHSIQEGLQKAQKSEQNHFANKIAEMASSLHLPG